ncbi:hypothetical protein [Candidatus Poriferisocius sp.]|uniref:hypothetical protein n=1 Tax=Candidatus Poriferisocius sp. TaxID=3101276 RepID=UPI003B5288D5
MSNQPDTTVDRLNVEHDNDSELTPEELNQVSGGSGSGKRSAYNANQQPWQATID